MYRRLRTLAVLGAFSAALTACSSTTAPTPAPSPPAASSATSDMPGMVEMQAVPGNGLTDTAAGYTLAVHTPPATTATSSPRFVIIHAGTPVTQFDLEQTKLMHFYLIRSDLTGFQHVHPSMAPDGTWSAPTTPVAPGHYRLYVQFLPHTPATPGTGAGGSAQKEEQTLSAPVTVPGPAIQTPLPEPSASTTVDGYTVSLTGVLHAGAEAPLTVTISHSHDGAPVTDLQPYLDTYAHVTAIHQGDLAFAHLHPLGAINGDHGGPTLSFHTLLPEPGKYRLFLQFHTGGILHTAALTVTATPQLGPRAGN